MTNKSLGVWKDGVMGKKGVGDKDEKRGGGDTGRLMGSRGHEQIFFFLSLGAWMGRTGLVETQVDG